MFIYIYVPTCACMICCNIHAYIMFWNNHAYVRCCAAYAYACICMHMHAHACMGIAMHAYACICMPLYACACIYSRSQPSTRTTGAGETLTLAWEGAMYTRSYVLVSQALCFAIWHSLEHLVGLTLTVCNANMIVLNPNLMVLDRIWYCWRFWTSCGCKSV